MSVRPSRSAARLVDTTVGGDTGWMLGGVTVGHTRNVMIKERQSGIGLDMAMEPRAQGADSSAPWTARRGSWCLQSYAHP